MLRNSEGGGGSGGGGWGGEGDGQVTVIDQNKDSEHLHRKA